MIQNIIYHGLYNGLSYNNIINQIMFAIANENETELLLLWDNDSPEIKELENKAKYLYNIWREKYYC